MRLVPILVASLLFAPIARGQLIVTLANFGTVIDEGGTPMAWSAPVFDAVGGLLDGPLFKAELTYDATPFAGAGFEAVPPSTPFLDLPAGNEQGLFFGGERTIPIDEAPGTPVTIVVRAWYDPDGLTPFPAATERGQSAPFVIEVPAPPGVGIPPLPVQLSGLTPFVVVPEPAVYGWVVGGLALIAGAAGRRWRKREVQSNGDACRRLP